MSASVWNGMGRRQLFQRLAALAGAATLPARIAVAATTKNIYRAIGVRPVINARGTFTIITGSQSLPQVKPRWKQLRETT